MRRSYRYDVDILRGDPDYSIVYTRSFRHKNNALKYAKQTVDMFKSLEFKAEDLRVYILDAKTRDIIFDWVGSESDVKGW